MKANICGMICKKRGPLEDVNPKEMITMAMTVTKLYVMCNITELMKQWNAGGGNWCGMIQRRAKSV